MLARKRVFACGAWRVHERCGVRWSISRHPPRPSHRSMRLSGGMYHCGVYGLLWFQESQRGYQTFRCFGIGGGGSPEVGREARERGQRWRSSSRECA